MADFGSLIRSWRCRRLEATLVDYSEGGLDAAERARVEQHVADCAKCAATLAALADVPAVLGAGAHPDGDDAFFLEQRQQVMREIRHLESAEEEPERARGFDWRLAMPVMAAAVIALAGYLSLRSPARPGETVLDALSTEDLAALSEVSGDLVAAPEVVPDVAPDATEESTEALDAAVDAGWIRVDPPPAWADLDDEDLEALRGITG